MCLKNSYSLWKRKQIVMDENDELSMLFMFLVLWGVFNAHDIGPYKTCHGVIVKYAGTRTGVNPLRILEGPLASSSLTNQSMSVMTNAGSAEPLGPYLYWKQRNTSIVIFSIIFRSFKGCLHKFVNELKMMSKKLLAMKIK